MAIRQIIPPSLTHSPVHISLPSLHISHSPDISYSEPETPRLARDRFRTTSSSNTIIYKESETVKKTDRARKAENSRIYRSKKQNAIENINEQVEDLHKRMDGFEERFDRMEDLHKRMDVLEERFDRMETMLNTILDKL